MPARCPSIAIVGAGFSGTMVAVHLLREARSPLRVILIERAETAGVGIAYREQSDRHLLNVRAEGMSAYPDQPAHFLKWLAALRGDESLVNPSGFMPRRLYGQYLRDQLSEAAANSRPDVRLELRHDEIVGIGLDGEHGGVRLMAAGGGRVLADQVVLALGNPGPADPPADDGGFYASPMYQASAWSPQGLLSLRHDDDVMLIGSGLTTLDWIASLAERGHRGRIQIVSRRGLLPREHRPTTPHRLGFDPLAVPATARALTRRVRAEIATAMAAGSDWRGVIDALRPHVQRLWQGLPRAEQLRFLRHVRTYWDVHRHRAAPRNLETVRRLADSGQLEVLAARPLRYRPAEGGIEVTLQPRGRAAAISRRVQRVVNCTGPDGNYRRYNHPLMLSLREQGLAVVDDNGLGIDTDREGRLRPASGAPSSRIWTLGPPRKGQLWETTAVPEIRGQAQSLAGLLLAATDATGQGLRDGLAPAAPAST